MGLCFALCGSGGDRLSRVLRHSTMGAGAFDGRVRDGIGWVTDAMVTKQCSRRGSNLGFNRMPVQFGLCYNHPLRGQSCGLRPFRTVVDGGTLQARIEQLVSVSSMRYRTSTSDLSTWWSSTALGGELVLRWVSRLDAFSDYPVRT